MIMIMIIMPANPLQLHHSFIHFKWLTPRTLLLLFLSSSSSLSSLPSSPGFISTKSGYSWSCWGSSTVTSAPRCYKQQIDTKIKLNQIQTQRRHKRKPQQRAEVIAAAAAATTTSKAHKITTTETAQRQEERQSYIQNHQR